MSLADDARAFLWSDGARWLVGLLEMDPADLDREGAVATQYLLHSPVDMHVTPNWVDTLVLDTAGSTPAMTLVM